MAVQVNCLERPAGLFQSLPENSNGVGMSSLLRIGGAAALLFVALSGVPAAADGNRVPRVDEYEDSLSKISRSDESPNDQFWFHAGLLTGLHWANHEYVKAGAKPRFCLPKSFQPVDLRDLIVDHLKKHGAFWRKEKASVALVALSAVREKFPC